MQVSPKQCHEAMKRILMAGKVPYVKANPGVGKSHIAYAVAKEFNLFVIDFRLTTADPTDLQGFPNTTQNNTRMGYLPPEDIPIVGDKIPEGYDGWFLFFDELSQAFPSLQNASYKIFLDRMVGQYKIHKNCVMAAAGNLDTDQANTYRMSTALQSRIIHLQLTVSNDDWQLWALENDIDYRIRAFLKWRKPLLHNFKPDHVDDTFACPRTWEFASDLIKFDPDQIDNISLANLSGTIGSGPAIEFHGFTQIYDKLPTYASLLKDPKGTIMPDEPSVLYALASLISHEDNLDTVPNVMPFITRLPVEFQVWTLRDAIKKKPELLYDPVIEDWKIKYADRLW